MENISFIIKHKDLDSIDFINQALPNTNANEKNDFLFMINTFLMLYQRHLNDKALKASSVLEHIESLIDLLTPHEFTSNTSEGATEEDFRTIFNSLTDTQGSKNIQLQMINENLKEYKGKPFNDKFPASINLTLVLLTMLKHSFIKLDKATIKYNQEESPSMTFGDKKKSSREEIFIQNLYATFKKFTGLTTKFNTDRSDYDVISGPFFELAKLCFKKNNQYTSDNALKKKISKALKGL